MWWRRMNEEKGGRGERGGRAGGMRSGRGREEGVRDVVEEDE